VSLNLEKWHRLMKTVEIWLGHPDEPPRYKSIECTSEEILSRIEQLTGNIFPVEYKEYCLTFGQGYFYTGEINVDSPPIEANYLDDYIESQIDIVSAWELDEKEAADLYSIQSPSRLDIQNLSRTCSCIGGMDCSLLLLDNRTYSDLDKSCDIYFLCDGLGEFYLGRSFFEFVRDCCLGEKLRDILPESHLEMIDFKYERRFFHFRTI
jgi:hypothetical protein